MFDEYTTKLNDEVIESETRTYLGLSQIGETCHRKLQYNHYMAFKSSITVRVKRLFKRGHDAEMEMIDDLQKIGIIVTDQQKAIKATAGHWRGHIDGIGEFIFERGFGRFLVEFKTHNDKSFKDLLKLKVKTSKPVHYDQMTAYMGYLELPKCLYVATNKNDSAYYLEWVEFNEERFKELKRKEFEIITSDALLPRIGTGTPTWFECKFCDAADVCFNNKPVESNCRTCQYVDVMDEGVWHCSKHKQNLTEAEQRAGCPSYNLSEMFSET